MHGCFRLLAAAAITSMLFAQNVLDSAPGKVKVLVFVRTDCPISNRYAPELQRIAAEFSAKPVQFFLVYSDKSETRSNIDKHIADYKFPGSVVLDPNQELAARAHASVTPQAAVFDGGGQLMYSGRIDDRWVDFGKARPYAERHDLEDAITDTLAGNPVPQPRTRAVGCYLADVK